MYSVHSWLGVITVAMFGIQIIYAFTIFYLIKWPVGSEGKKSKYVNIHHFIGHIVFALGLATCMTGLQDMQSSDLASSGMAMSADTNSSYVASGVVTSGDDMGDSGYLPSSTLSMLSASGAILLFALGMSTFAAVRFMTPAQSTIPLEPPSKGAEESPLFGEGSSLEAT